MQRFEITITDEESKALAWDALSPFEWIDNLVHNKTRQCVDAICMLGFQDETDTIISAPDKNKIQALLHAAGITIRPIEDWPQSVKQAAVGFANIKSATERLQEEQP